MMHQRGQGGLALGNLVDRRLCRRLVRLGMLVLLTEPLANVALAFTPPAYSHSGCLDFP
jgi:TctA family transporter